MNDYQKQATDFLAKHGITFAVEYIGKDCPMYCEDALANRDMGKLDSYPRKTHIHGKHYRATFTRENAAPLVIDFWNSYADEEFNHARQHKFLFPKRNFGKPRTVSAYDVLASVQKHDVGTFEDFCREFGYNTDSSYLAVCEEYRKVESFFDDGMMLELQDIQ